MGFALLATIIPDSENGSKKVAYDLKTEIKNWKVQIETTRKIFQKYGLELETFNELNRSLYDYVLELLEKSRNCLLNRDEPYRILFRNKDLYDYWVMFGSLLSELLNITMDPDFNKKGRIIDSLISISIMLWNIESVLDDMIG